MLSNQACWYLGGHWPVNAKASVGNSAPEPKAMQELVDAGLAEHKNDALGERWELTTAGREMKYA